MNPNLNTPPHFSLRICRDPLITFVIFLRHTLPVQISNRYVRRPNPCCPFISPIALSFFPPRSVSKALLNRCRPAIPGYRCRWIPIEGMWTTQPLPPFSLAVAGTVWRPHTLMARLPAVAVIKSSAPPRRPTSGPSIPLCAACDFPSEHIAGSSVLLIYSRFLCLQEVHTMAPD